MENDLKLVATCDTGFEAEILRGRLESEEIPAFIHDAHVTSLAMPPSVIGGVKVLVRAADYELAMQVLAVNGEENDAPADWGSCPTCSGRKLEPRTDIQRSRIAAILTLFLGLISSSGYRQANYTCLDCGHDTRKPNP